MDDGHDEDFPRLGQIDDPVALIDQLPHIVAALGLGDGTADLRKVFQLLDGCHDPLGKAPGIVGRVLGDVGLEIPYIGAGPVRPRDHF